VAGDVAGKKGKKEGGDGRDDRRLVVGRRLSGREIETEQKEMVDTGGRRNRGGVGCGLG